MAYVIIEDFRAGLDRRKLPAASPPGSLQVLSNAHVTRGGEIEKRQAFVAKYALPAGQTFGFAGANGVLYTFGSVAGPAIPAGVAYRRLEHPSSQAMSGVVQSEFYNGQTGVIASFDNGDVLLFFNGTRVTDWDLGSGYATAGQKPTSLLTFDDKLYATYLSLLGFSAIGDAADWHGTGSGFINMSNQSSGSETLVGLAAYQNNMAVFARRNTQIWSLDSDPLNNAKRQVLGNIGLLAARSAVSFGDVDVFFLSDTGVRSLRARDSSNQAGVSDVGTPIDGEILAYMQMLTDAQKAAAVAAIDPIDGRYLLAIGDRVYVFSYYSSARISAWSRYELGFSVSEFVSMDGRLWARSGDTIYLLGGDSGTVYDSSEVVVETPFIDGRTLATFKNFTGFDIVCEGEWEIYVNTDPNNDDAWTKIATVQGTTISNRAIQWTGYSPVVRLRLLSRTAGAARLSKLIIHYEQADAD